MGSCLGAGNLLRRARQEFDCRHNGLRQSAGGAWRTAFASGGQWMQLALEQLRGKPLAGSQHSLNALGLIKYALASGAALAFVALALWFEQPLWLVLCIPAFYAVEAQMVFLFPVALDGSRQPFREGRLWTRKAGGTLTVMRVVLPVACTMLFGGFVGQGFIRSWCVGCLAICIWYEELRQGQPQRQIASAA